MKKFLVIVAIIVAVIATITGSFLAGMHMTEVSEINVYEWEVIEGPNGPEIAITEITMDEAMEWLDTNTYEVSYF